MTSSLPKGVGVDPGNTQFITREDVSFGGESGVRAANFLRQTPSLECISFTGSRTFVSVHAQVFSDILNLTTRLQELTLVNCDFPQNALFDFSGALKNNSTLTKLDLSNNKLEDQGATLLSAAIRTNAVLKTLHLRFCQVGDEGATHLLNSLKSQSSFLGICDLNHNTVSQSLLDQIKKQTEINRGKSRPQPPSSSSSSKGIIHKDRYRVSQADLLCDEDNAGLSPEYRERVIETRIKWLDSLPSSGGTHREVIPESYLLQAQVALRILLALTATLALAETYITLNTYSVNHLSAALLFTTLFVFLKQLPPILTTALKLNYHALSYDKMPDLIAALTMLFFRDPDNKLKLKLPYGSGAETILKWANERSFLVPIYKCYFPDNGIWGKFTIFPFKVEYDFDSPFSNEKK